MKKVTWLIGSALLLVGAGCSSASPEQASLELTYVLPEDGSVTVTKNAVAAGQLVNADALLAQATECGFARTAEYYLDIENLFKEKTADQYTFTTTGDYVVPSSWIVTVMPNSPLYSSTASFKQDFDICAAGGDLYPVTAGQKLCYSQIVAAAVTKRRRNSHTWLRCRSRSNRTNTLSRIAHR